MTTLIFDESKFETGTASQSDLSPYITLVAKVEGADEYVDDHLYPLDASIEGKTDFLEQAKELIGASKTDSIVFKVAENELSEVLSNLFFDENGQPNESLFQFGELPPHIQDVVMAYTQTNAFQADSEMALQDILTEASDAYLGKYDSPCEYARYQYDEKIFGSDLDTDYDFDVLANFVNFDRLGEHLITTVQDIEVVNNHYFK